MANELDKLKGLDDALAAGVSPQLLEGVEAERFVMEAVTQARGSADSINVSKSSDLGETAFATALAISNDLPHKLLVDPGAPFEREAIASLSMIKNSSPAEFQRIRDRLKKAGVGLRDLEILIRQHEFESIDKDASNASTGFMGETQSSIEESEFPLPTGVCCPSGYLIQSSGVRRRRDSERGPKWETISHEPVFVSGRTENLDDNTKGMELSFGVDGRGLQTRVVGQRVISDANQLLELSSFGLQVTTLNRSDLVGFLAAQFDASKQTLPSKLTTGRSGWIEVADGLAFVVGAQVFSRRGSMGPTLEFAPANAHAQSILKSTAPKGELLTWIDAVRPLMKFRHFVFGLGAAFGAPLLQPLKVTNLIIHFQGESSRGKTTLAMVAASVYAFPGDSSNPNAFIRQWRGTDNAIESLAFAHNGLILILDEVGQADLNTPKKVIYLVGNGQVKSRADSTGQVRPAKNFSLILLSTGELSLAGNQTTTGQEVRMVEISKSPFDEDQSDLRDFVDQLRASIHDNYGRAGETYLREVVEVVNDAGRRKSLVDAFEVKHRKLLKWQNSPFHARNARAYAAMWLGFEEANRLFALIADPVQVEGIFVRLYQEAGEKWKADATTVEKAIRYVWDAIDANPFRFDMLDGGINMLGTRIQCNGLNECYAFFESQLDKVLEDGGFDPKSTKQAFREKSYVLLAKDGGLPQVRLPNGPQRPRSYVFHRSKAPQLYSDPASGVPEE